MDGSTRSATHAMTASELCTKAEQLGVDGKYKEAIQLLNLAIRKAPGNQNVYKLKGFSLMSLRRYGAALTAFRKCLSLAPQRPYYHYYLGKTYSLMKKYHLAITEYRKALGSKWPYSDKGFTTSIIYRQMGLTYVSSRKPGEALWCYEKVFSMGDYFGAPLLKRAADLKKKKIQQKKPEWAK